MSIETSKLKFGWYSVSMPHVGEVEPETVLCPPLSQNDFADGWQAVLPRKTPKADIYSWNVNLAQLPPHLWHKCHVNYREGKPYYNRVRDGIYLYNVALTEHDDNMRTLYKELQRPVLNKGYISDLYEMVKEHASGWLLIRARNYLNK